MATAVRISVALRPQRPKRAGSARAFVINQEVRKEEAKVVDTLSVADISGKAVMCRCWKSKTFPKQEMAACTCQPDKETGDNVGPLIIENKA